MRHMKRSSVERRIENVAETWCLEPTLKQNTNDDESLMFKMCLATVVVALKSVVETFYKNF